MKKNCSNLERLEDQLQFTIDCMALDEEIWRTLKNGAHVKFDESGEIVAGPKWYKDLKNSNKKKVAKQDKLSESTAGKVVKATVNGNHVWQRPGTHGYFEVFSKNYNENGRSATFRTIKAAKEYLQTNPKF